MANVGFAALRGSIVLLERVSKSENAFRKLINIVDECERLFKKLKRTDIPYYIFIDEMEAYYGDSDLFKRAKEEAKQRTLPSGNAP